MHLPLPKRRWYQFRLLAMLVLMGVAPILLTFLYFAIEDARKANQTPKPNREFRTLEAIFEEAKDEP
ncbi:MAG: hypothetical protein ACR2FY_06255 [Pirellulaceae bacterium]